MRALAAMLVPAMAACSGAGQKPRAPAAIPPIARVHFDDDFGLIFVTATVAGSARAFLLDSSAHQDLLDRAVADELKLPLQAQGSAAQTGPMDGFVSAVQVEMFVGAVPFSARDMWVGPLGGLAQRVGRKVDGVLGYELLERYVVTVDYAAQELVFYDPQHAPTSGDPIPIALGDHDALVGVVLHDGSNAVAATLNVDTTSPAPVELTTRFVTDHHLLESVPNVARSSLGVAHAALARLSAIRVGAATLGPLPIGYRDDEHAYAGTLGAELLQQFTVTFDYPHHRLLLAGRERPPALRVDGSGLVLATFADDLKRCEVLAVAPGSPAGISGIAAGDEIAAINDVPFAELGLAALWSLLRQQGTVRLTIRHAGSERVIAMALRPLV